MNTDNPTTLTELTATLLAACGVPTTAEELLEVFGPLDADKALELLATAANAGYGARTGTVLDGRLESARQ